MRCLSALVCILFFSTLCFASKQGDIKQGNKLYQQGKYEAAADKFNDALKKDADSDIINFNLGAAFYKKEDYPKAVEHFQKSLLSDDKAIQTKAHYNLGNSLYKAGVAKENSDLNTAVQSLEQSLDHYEKAMAADDKDKDAKFNYDFVKKELERLKEKLKQQQEEQKNQQSQQDQKDQSQKSEQQSPENKEQQQDQQSQESQQPESQQQDSQQQKAQQEEAESKESQEQNQPSPSENEENKQEQSVQEKEGSQGQKEDSQKQDEGSSQNISGQSARELTEQEAQMLLREYQQNEEPKGMLNLRLQRGQEREVEKDW